MSPKAIVKRDVRSQSDAISISMEEKNDYIAMHVGGTAGGFEGKPFIQVSWKIGPNYQTVFLGARETLALAAWFADHITVPEPEIVGLDKYGKKR